MNMSLCMIVQKACRLCKVKIFHRQNALKEVKSARSSFFFVVKQLQMIPDPPSKWHKNV